MFLTTVHSNYVLAEQTANNWQGEGCKNYDDSQDICLDEAKADHASDVPAEKTMDSLMYHLMREDLKKDVLVKVTEDYAASRELSNEYMTSFAKRMIWLGKALLSKYDVEEVEQDEEVEEAE